MVLACIPIALCQSDHTLVPMQQAQDAAYAIATCALKAALGIVFGKSNLAEGKVDDANALIAEGGTEGVAEGDIQFIRLFLQAQGFMNMLTPATQPADHMQCKRLAA